MPKRPVQSENDDELKQHYRRLGCKSEEQYRAWCEGQGIRPGGRKSLSERNRELALIEHANQESALKTARHVYRHPEEVLRAISTGATDGIPIQQQPHLQHIYNLFLTLLRQAKVRDAFLRLLLVTCRRKGFEDLSPVVSRYEGDGNTLIGGLLAMAYRYKDWRQQPETWKPSSHNGRRQFSELAQHIFCRYSAPGFLLSSWFQGSDSAARATQDWYLQVGNGVSLRKLKIPLTLTKRMAHAALTTVPDTCSVEEGWRWAQVVGMGGSERLARAVVATPLGVGWAEERFWVHVVRFFVENPLMDPGHVGPLVDYLRYERYTPRDPEDRDRLPVRFTMKGRTVPALVARMEQWHRRLNQQTRIQVGDWKPCGVEGFFETGLDAATGQQLRWTITELTSARELFAEGAAMSHCVGTYADTCARGGIAVWSVRVERGDDTTPERVMTIAISGGRQITEARGKRNALPGEKTTGAAVRLTPEDAALLQRASRVVRNWAAVRNLRLPHYL